MKRLLTAAAVVVAVSTPAIADDYSTSLDYAPHLYSRLHLYSTPPALLALRPAEAVIAPADDLLRHARRDAEDARWAAEAVERELSALRVEMSYLRSELDMLELGRARPHDSFSIFASGPRGLD